MRKALIYIVLFFIIGNGVVFYNTPYLLDNFDISSIYSNKIYITALIILFIIYVILEVISSINRIILTRKEEEERQIKLMDKIKKCDPTIDEYELVDTVFEIYKKIQDACSNFDLNTINKHVTNEVYSGYKEELRNLKIKNRIFKSDNITFDYGKLLDISKYHNVIKTRVYLSVSSCNSIIDSITNKIIKGGKFRVYTSYMFTFIKIIDECPTCGSNISNDNNVCSNCGNSIIKSNHNWIMAKREIINKGRD